MRVAFSAALGLIELVGLTTAIVCADTAVKAAKVQLLGYELTKGGGLVTVKLTGDVSAVLAAVKAGTAAAARVGTVLSQTIIPRPHNDLDKMVDTEETVKAVVPKHKLEAIEEKEEPLSSSEEANTGELMHPETMEELAQGAELEGVSQNQEDKIDLAVSSVTDTVSGPQPLPNESVEKPEVEQILIESETDLTEQETSSELTEQKTDKLDQKKATCNICGDPECPRRKGESHNFCIHNGENQ